MSVALTDILLELSDPANLARFKDDPEGYLEGTSLTADEMACLVTGDRLGLVRHARSVENGDEHQQFNRYSARDLIIEVDPVVELHLEAHDQVAVAGAGMIFIDENGLRYRAVAKSE